MTHPDPYHYEPSANPNEGSNPYADAGASATPAATPVGPLPIPGYAQPAGTQPSFPGTYQPVTPYSYGPVDPKSPINPVTGKARRPAVIIWGLVLTALMASYGLTIGFFAMFFGASTSMLIQGTWLNSDAVFGMILMAFSVALLTFAIMANHGHKWAALTLLSVAIASVVYLYIAYPAAYGVIAFLLAPCVLPFILPQCFRFYRLSAELAKNPVHTGPPLPPHLPRH